jgi:ppGpp synthetase/RelA/SpoT-type nucleotidyltranferase
MTIKTETIKKFIDEYKIKQSIYEDFAENVDSFLKILLRNNEFRYQAVFSRGKEPGSLLRKIIEDKELQKLKSVTEIDDLAGCRIIFYLDKDIERFRNHIYKEFNVIKEELKYSEDEYNALHFVVTLNKDRLKLMEYAKYSSLKCEIQLTTVLYHAWSEMNHDIIYKPQKELSNFDKQAFDLLKKQFADVMKNHIKKAQHTFDFISYQIEKIKQGKQVFDIKFLNNIIHSESNNELHENLTLLHKYIGEFGDKTPKELNIIKIVESALKKSKTLKIEPIKTTIGNLKGYTYVDVVNICLDILNDLRYFYPEEVFSLLIMLSLDKEPEVKKKSLEVLSRLSQYNLHVLQKIGFYPQFLVLEKIEKWSTKQLVERIESITEALKELLSPSFEGHSMKDYKTFSIQFGALKVSSDLKEIRERTIVLLKKIYLLVKDLKQRQKIIRTLQGATRLPDRDNYSEDMKNMVLDDINDLIDYYISIIPNADNEIVKDLEEDAYWLSRRFDVKKLTRIKELQSLISSNEEYVIFRVFVGFDYYTTDTEKVDPEKIDFKKVDARRKTKIKEFINNISGENYKDWERKILSVIKNYSFPEDQGKFWHFNFFLNELSKQKPEIAYKLLIENEVKLEPFLTNLIAGIWESRLKRLGKELIYKWVKEGKYLSACALVFDYVGEMDKSLINEIFKKAKEIENKEVQNDTFNNIIRSIVKNFPKHKNTKNLFINSIKELTKNKYWYWIYNEWRSRCLILKALTRADVEIIFENLLFLSDIKYPVEEVLTPIAEKYPQKIISFFYKRFLVKKRKKQEDHYDAIPYSLHELNKPLSENAKIVVPEILKWFKKKDSLLHWEGSHLIEAIFPVFNKSLEEELIKLIKSKNEKNIRIVFNILRTYKGEEFLHNICKELIKEYPENEDYHEKIFIILSQMGVVSGEYGFVKGFEKKKEEIQSWKKDKNKDIQLFVKKYEDYLDKRILYEKKQADEDIELRKRQFDS